MEEALKMATHIEAIGALETPKFEVRGLEQDSGAGAMKEVGRQLVEMRKALLVVRQAVHTSRNQAGIPVDSIVDVGADTCRYCKNLGHWIYNCPKLEEKNARAKLQRKADPEK